MTSNLRLILTTLFAMFLGVFFLLYLDEGTLFLATVLLAVVAIKQINSKIEANENFDTGKISINIVIGLWFSLSIAPAFSVELKDLLTLSNGFIVQAILSSALFAVYFKSDISVIGKIKTRVKGGVGIVVSALIAGAAAGITSSALWQVYLNIAKVL